MRGALIRKYRSFVKIINTYEFKRYTRYKLILLTKFAISHSRMLLYKGIKILYYDVNSERGRCITDRRESCCIGFCDDQSFARVNL